MAKKYQCDISGKMYDGEGKHVIEADLNDQVSVRIRFFKRVSKSEKREMDIGPEGEAIVLTALKPVSEKVAK